MSARIALFVFGCSAAGIGWLMHSGAGAVWVFFGAVLALCSFLPEEA